MQRCLWFRSRFQMGPTGSNSRPEARQEIVLHLSHRTWNTGSGGRLVLNTCFRWRIWTQVCCLKLSIQAWPETGDCDSFDSCETVKRRPETVTMRLMQFNKYRFDGVSDLLMSLATFLWIWKYVYGNSYMPTQSAACFSQSAVWRNRLHLRQKRWPVSFDYMQDNFI